MILKKGDYVTILPAREAYDCDDKCCNSNPIRRSLGRVVHATGRGPPMVYTVEHLADGKREAFPEHFLRKLSPLEALAKLSWSE